MAIILPPTGARCGRTEGFVNRDKVGTDLGIRFPQSSKSAYILWFELRVINLFKVLGRGWKSRNSPLFAILICEHHRSAGTRYHALTAAGGAPGDAVLIDLFCTLGHVLCSPEGRFVGLDDAALAREVRKRRVDMSVRVFEGGLQVVAATELIALYPCDFAEHRARGAGITLYAPSERAIPPQFCMIWHRRHNGDPAHAWLRVIVRDILAPLKSGHNVPSP